MNTNNINVIQCPFKGGKAVYRARSILHKMGYVEIYDDRNYCTLLGYFRQLAVFDSLFGSTNLFAYPNPSNSTVQIFYKAETNSKRELVFVDAYGKQLEEFEITTNKPFIFNIEKFAEGCYILKDKTKNKTHCKITVIR